MSTANINKRVKSYVVSNPPLGCISGSCPYTVSESDYAKEREYWINSCTASNKKFLNNKKKVEAACMSEFDNATSTLKRGVYEENHARNNELFDLSFSNNNNTILYIILIITLAFIAYNLL